MPEDLSWHADGHRLSLMLDRSQIEVRLELCPHGKKPESPCYHRYAKCVVEYFINLYGLECNVGRCPPSGSMEVAWSLVGDPYDIDTCQVWLLPLTDEAFAAFLADFTSDDPTDS